MSVLLALCCSFFWRQGCLNSVLTLFVYCFLHTELSLISLHWFLTGFASVVHMKVLLRIWDLFFYEGSVSLFQVTLGMMKMKVTPPAECCGVHPSYFKWHFGMAAIALEWPICSILLLMGRYHITVYCRKQRCWSWTTLHRSSMPCLMCQEMCRMLTNS